MLEYTTEQINEIEKEKRLSAMRDRARVFREVFGERGSPTSHGQVIMEALLVKFGHALPPNVLDNQGRTDPYQTWRRLGHFDVLEFINTQIDYKETHVHTSSERT